jgi:carnitine-CoA ligase
MRSVAAAGKLNTILDVLRTAVEAYEDRLLLVIAGERLTYRDFYARVNSLGQGLRDIGVQPGDRVATMLDNNADGAVSWYAINSIGAVHVPLSTAVRGSFLQHHLHDSEPTALIYEDHYARFIELAKSPDLAMPRLIDRSNSVGAAPARDPGVVALADVYAGEQELSVAAVGPSDLSALMYTAGTTGMSKGCMISQKMACNLARTQLFTSGRQAEEMLLTPLPLFHSNAPVTTLLSSMMIGGACTIEPRFSVSDFWPSVKRSGARVVSLLGTMAHLISRMPDNEPMAQCYGQIRVVWSIPFPEEIAEIWQRRFGVESAGSPGYGQTEVGLITARKVYEPAPAGTAGQEHHAFEVRIVDDHDNEVPRGESGEIVVRPREPDVMFTGYWRSPEATLRQSRNLWFHCGDYGRLDEEGWLYFVDRKKDYLRRRGENVSSYELEMAVEQHPEVLEAAVFGVPSPVLEDDVKVVVVLHDGAGLTPPQLSAWLFERVPYFAEPRYIEFRQELPKSPLGRVYKTELRAEHDPARCWDREAQLSEAR